MWWRGGKNILRKLFPGLFGDRKLLRALLHLAERLLITPELLREWPQALRDLVQEMDDLFDFSYLFLAFQRKEEIEVWVFACCPALSEHRELFEGTIREVLEKRGFLKEGLPLRFEFEDLGREERDMILQPTDISQICKVLHLSRQGLKGAAGLGIPQRAKLGEDQLLALETLLTAVLNLSISVKTLEAYTLHLEFQATRDPLTGLYNRRAFQDFLSLEIERARRQGYRFALLFVDVDHFKFINDAYGHEVGDRFLSHLAHFLRQVFRRGDILARYGGDEFVALLPHTDLQNLQRILERLFVALKGLSFCTPDGKGLGVSLSVGVAVFPDHATTPERLLSLADRALYRAKETGKARWALPSEKDLARPETECRQRNLVVLEALEKDRVVPFFQPILEIETQRIAAYEVLIRILDQEGRFLPAGKFIPSAERMGVITRLERLLWARALEKAAETPGEFLLFFNLSPRSLLQPEFRRCLGKLLEKFDIDPRRIVVELTERETVRDFSELQEAVQDLKEMGLALALDDFGSGFSSYRYLKHLPVDYIKLEGEVVRSMLSEEIDRAFVAGAVTLAKLLGVRIVAEYVEDRALLEELRRLGVDYAQGYYIGRPEPEISEQLQQLEKGHPADSPGQAS